MSQPITLTLAQRAPRLTRAVVLFTPFKFVSWDHSKLGDNY